MIDKNNTTKILPYLVKDNSMNIVDVVSRTGFSCLGWNAPFPKLVKKFHGPVVLR